jgi:hypothetical protein
MSRQKKIIIPPINVIAKFIGVPDLKDWEGNCYAIACKIVNDEVIHDDCRAVYGHYLGYISQKSMFRNRRGMPFCQHGWVELSNGDIVDPTRWVFEAKDPYIAFIKKDEAVAEEYDEGGNGWRHATTNPPPAYSADDKQVSFKYEEFDRCDGRTYVLGLLGDKRKEIDKLSDAQIFWLANLSLQTLGIYAREIYAYIEFVGCDAFIPWDNKNKAFEIKQKV